MRLPKSERRPQVRHRLRRDASLLLEPDERVHRPRPTAALITSSGFELERVPPRRRESFVAFAHGCRRLLEDAARENKERETATEKHLESILQDMFRMGVAWYVIEALGRAYDADAKDIWRGWQDHALSQLELLPPAGVRDILLDVIDAVDPSSWHAFPHWFTTRDDLDIAQPWMRACAARWLPMFTPAGAIDTRLLEDSNRLVRLFTAMNCAIAGYPATESLIRALQDGASDHTWIWSSEEYDSGWDGQCAALEMLLKIAPTLPWARERCRRLIRDDLDCLERLPSQCREQIHPRVACLQQALRTAERSEDAPPA